MKRDLFQARAQLTASTEVLQIINSSADALEPVFQAVLEKAMKLCEAAFGFLTIYDGEKFSPVAQCGVPDALAAYFAKGMDQPRPGEAHARLLDGEDIVHNLDQKSEEVYRQGSPLRRAIVDLGGVRSALVVALRKDNVLLGALTIYRKEVRAFTQRQIALLQNFGAQAAIAIANARLFDQVQARTADLSESLEQQAATADVLKTISRSTFDLQPVLDTLVKSAAQLCNADMAFIMRRVGNEYRAGAAIGYTDAYIEFLTNNPLTISRGTVTGRAVIEKHPVQILDVVADPEYTLHDATTLAGQRTALGVPLLRESEPIGVIVLARQRVEAFTDSQIDLVASFADQAVIAIENVRLFNETKEALERQTATADVLKVIASSPSDVQPVFEAIVQAGLKLFPSSTVMIVLANEGIVRAAAIADVEPKLAELLRNAFPSPLTRDYMHAVAILDRRLVDVPDAECGPAEFAAGLKLFLSTDHRAITIMPLLRGDEAIGALSVVRRLAGPLSNHQLELLKTFSDQAVIAIENARLLSELRRRTSDLSEALERQTATADVLNVIGRSPTDAAPVFDVIGERAEKLCDAEISVVSILENDLIKLAGIRGISKEGVELFRAQFPLRLDRQTVTSRTINSGTIVHVADVLADPTYDNKTLAAQTGYRSCLGVPMHNQGQVMGAIFVARTEPGPFSDNQIQLLQIFADQAVIAIGNVRLFEEVQRRTRELSESLEQQVATSEVLQVISSSPGELEPVFQSMLANATRLCEAECGVMWLREGEAFRSVAIHGPLPPAYVEQWRTGTPVHLTPHGPLAILVQTRKAVHIADMRKDRSYLDRDPLPVAAVEVAGIRTLLLVPMSKEDELVGGIAIYRQEVRPFTDKQVELVSTFARQAVIAIENARLLKELRHRTQDLSRSLHELRTAQDRLVQTEKLASLGQLTAGIAHEIKNPLNFVNNFSALSAELTDELRDLLGRAALTDRMREEVGELTKLLKENLEKIAQHGKRADSIVKNMLLHSREGSGEQRSADINALVEESLNLAYHGARAEKSVFNITLQRDFDASAGSIELFPQEITRALLNLLSNGFYAATKRLNESGGEGFEPTLLAATKNLGSTVEIRIRDNGTGIPPELKEKIFNPFFTTKPPGEGTGLGLSMSHDIIVKQHGGRIDVDTEPGVYTEFIISLPRKKSAL